MIVAWKDNNDGYYQCSVSSEDEIPSWVKGMTRLTDAEASAVLAEGRPKQIAQEKIAALENEITPDVIRAFLLRPNVPITRPNSAVKVPKKPIDFIADIDAQIETLRATLQP